MTERRPRRRSLVDELEEEMPMDAAAAKAAVESVALINSTLKAAGIRQSELARMLELTEGRVSQVVNGDGNVRVSTLAKFLRAAGYNLALNAEPVTQAQPSSSAHHLPTDGALRNAKYMSFKTVLGVTDVGVSKGEVLEWSDMHPAFRLQEEYKVIHNLETGEFEDLPRPVRREARSRTYTQTVVEANGSHVSA
jgi:transcriptional regulator with XRE-family HTH domain